MSRLRELFATSLRIALFVSFYVVAFGAIVWVIPSLPLQWAGLAAVAVATTLFLRDAVKPPNVYWTGSSMRGRDLAIAAALPFAILLPVDLAGVVAGSLRHPLEGDVPFHWLAAVLVPAVVHEELLFRGFAFWRLARFDSRLAIAASALLFALLHGGNPMIGAIGMVNLLLGGVLLSVVVLRSGSVIAGIVTHLLWNVLLGPVLGHEVSGIESPGTLLGAVDLGPALLTGGEFGLEGSVALTLTQLVAIALLVRWYPAGDGPAGRNHRSPSPVVEP